MLYGNAHIHLKCIYTNLFARQIAIVVANLKVQAEHRRQFAEILFVGAKQLHQSNGQHEQAARLADGHLLVLHLGGTRKVVAPIDLHALAAVQLEQLFRVHFGCLYAGGKKNQNNPYSWLHI